MSASLHQIFEGFGLTPTHGQAELFQAFEDFWVAPWDRKVFVLNGYAGTGKTTVLRAITEYARQQKSSTFLMAPTGRAAKVMSGYTGRQALTIHKKIYWGRDPKNPLGGMRLQNNMHQRTLFVVDEASMISGQSSAFLGGSLLDHLMEYVFNGKACSLMLIGDEAQLPPVGTVHSPALQPQYLKRNYHLEVYGAALKEVVRQGKESGILDNATWIRNNLEHNEMPELTQHPDVQFISHYEVEEELSTAYATYGEDETIVLSRSNYRCFFYNQQIRVRVRWTESKLDGGDRLMVIRNNYFWAKEDPKIGFIANGEMIRLNSVRRYEEVHGFEFADVICTLIDQEDQPEVEVKILLDVLYEKGPTLTKERLNELRSSVESDYYHITSKKERMEEMRKDPYFNALHVKFGYAITTHKAQGGQWECVFVDFPNFEEWNEEAFRWLYTALTRAVSKLYIVNAPDQLN